MNPPPRLLGLHPRNNVAVASACLWSGLLSGLPPRQKWGLRGKFGDISRATIDAGGTA